METAIQLNDIVRRKAESFALQWHLSEYPSGTLSGDFDAILERIENDELWEDIVPCEEYERMPCYVLAQNIENMKEALINTFGGLK
jgi:hypothetical protein